MFKAQGVVAAGADSPQLDVQADGTFIVVPNMFHRLFVVFISTSGRMLPAYFVLMTSRTQRLYQAVLERIAGDLGQPIHRFMSDWESAIQGAAEAV